MVLRTGVDLIEIKRFARAIERHGNRLLMRIFSEQEIQDAGGRVESLAARFAAKEAVSKALGTGIGEVTWHEIIILRGESREPILKLCGRAEDLARVLGIELWAISLSHTQDLAIALVVASGSTANI